MYLIRRSRVGAWAVLLAIGCLVALLALPMSAFAQEEVLYGCNGGGGDDVPNPSNLYLINPATGAATLVGPMGIASCSGLAFDGSGVLYAVGRDPANPNDRFSLFTVNPNTGAATLIGESHHSFGGEGVSRISDLSFRSDNRLFAYLEWEDGLGRLNKATGAVNELGFTNTPSCCGNGIAFDAADTLFHANEEQLNTLHQTTGQFTLVGLHTWPNVYCPVDEEGDPRINALDFNSGGTLFGSLNCGRGGSGPNYLVRVNTTTGKVRNIGVSVDGLDGIAFGEAEAEFVPEWGSIALLGSGLAGLAGYASLRWRKS